MFHVEEGDVVRMTITNDSGDVHPMHLHGHHAVVLSRNGEAASGSPWWVDSLNVADGDSYEIAFVADNPGIWMDHCHNLDHARDGLVAHLAYAGVTEPFRVGGGRQRAGVTGTRRWRPVGEGGVQQRLGGPAHQLERFVARQRGDVGQPDEGLDPRGAADGEGEPVHLVAGQPRASGSSASSIQRMARPWRSGRAACSASGSRDSRSMVRCWCSVSLISSVKRSITSRSRSAGSSDAPGVSSDEAAVSGCAATSSARWFGKYR